MSNGREHIDPRLLNLIEWANEQPWLFVKNLRQGDILEIQTQNTLYTMKIINPENGDVLVTSDGKHITKETPAYIWGTTLTGTGTMIKMGSITVGFRLILSVEGLGVLRLSPTKEVRVNGVKVLPA